MRLPKSIAGRIALYVGIAHVVLVIVVACYVAWLAVSHVPQWQLTWRHLEAVDWPASKLMRASWWPTERVPFLPWPLDAPRAFAIPVAVLGLFGTAWYALLGYLVGLVVQRMSGIRQANPGATSA